MLYDVFKTLHVIGVVLLIGNVTVTSFWKVMADRTGDAHVVANAQYIVTVSDWFFTAGGIALIVLGGFGAAWVVKMDPFGAPWLTQAEALFVVSGSVWLFVLIPLQIRQARLARAFALGGEIPPAYWRAARLWLIWGLIATVPLVAAVYVMIAKQ